MDLDLHQADKHVIRQVFDVIDTWSTAVTSRKQTYRKSVCCRPILETRTRRTRRSRTAYAYTQPT
jgi:hypothetical protein